MLKIDDIIVGEGIEATSGKKVTIHYTGKFEDGRVFDSSRPRNEPFQFTLGAGQVIQGFDLGVMGMKVGGQRTVYIPSELGYGKRGAPGAIPPDTDLIFELELLAVK